MTAALFHPNLYRGHSYTDFLCLKKTSLILRRIFFFSTFKTFKNIYATNWAYHGRWDCNGILEKVCQAFVNNYLAHKPLHLLQPWQDRFFMQVFRFWNRGIRSQKLTLHFFIHSKLSTFLECHSSIYNRFSHFNKGIDPPQPKRWPKSAKTACNRIAADLIKYIYLLYALCIRGADP